MTTTKSAPLDYAQPTPSHRTHPRPSTTPRESDDQGAHLLRLVLDLQLDALLLGLGAAAVQESRTPAPASHASTVPPWPRWTVEDIDLARTLAAEAVTSGAALPATLGPGPAAQEEQIVLDRLTARYESMRNLLADLLARTARDFPAASRAQLHALMAHCQRRLTELHDLAVTTQRAHAGQPGDHEYLPGELLG